MTGSGSTRRLIALLTVCVVGASVLTGCQTARVGARCSSGSAQNGNYILICRKGRWTRWITKGQGLQLLKAYLDAHPPPTTPPPPPPPPPVPVNFDGAFGSAGQRGPTTIDLTGWAYDLDAADPLTVQIVDHGAVVATGIADQPGMPTPGSFPVAIGTNHKYSIAVPAPAGDHLLCVIGVRPRDGATEGLGCINYPTVAPTESNGVATLLEVAEMTSGGLLHLSGYVTPGSGSVVGFTWGPPAYSGSTPTNDVNLSGPMLTARPDIGSGALGFDVIAFSGQYTPNRTNAPTICLYLLAQPDAGFSCRPIQQVGSD